MPELLGGKDYATQLLCDCPHLFRNDFDQGFVGAEVVRGQEGDMCFLIGFNELTIGFVVTFKCLADTILISHVYISL